MTRPHGMAGRLAAAFIDSKLTPLFLVAALAMGALAVVALPREEEPQIIVPMIDVMVQMPGASPAEVEQRVTRPMEKLHLGDPRRRVRLLDVEPGPLHGDRPLLRRPERRAGHRPAQSEALRQHGPDPAGRVAAHREAAVDRRRAGDGAHAVGRALLGRRAPAGRGAAARRHQGGPRRVGGDHRRRAPAAGHRGDRPGAPLLVRHRPARRAARDPVGQHASARGRDRQRGPKRDRRGGGLDRQRGAPRQRGRRCARRTLGVAARCRRRPRRGRRADVVRLPLRARRPRLPGGDDLGGQAQGRQRHRPHAPDLGQARYRPRRPGAVRSADHRHPELRGHRRPQVERAALAHVPVGDLGGHPDLAHAGPPRGGRGAGRHPGHAGADAAGHSISTVTR